MAFRFLALCTAASARICSQTRPYRPFLFAFAVATTAVGCGGSGGTRSPLPVTNSGLATSSSAIDNDAALEQAVADAHREAGGGTKYGVIDGEWKAPPPAPGQPGYYIIDGEVVPGPPDDSLPPTEPAPLEASRVLPAPQATQNCSTFQGDVPPPCTSTGPFRRVFTAPGNSFALAHLTFPANNPTMPEGKTPLNGDTGFAYMEGWTLAGRNIGNSEFGFQYSATHNNYTAYIRTYQPVGYFILVLNNIAVHYLPASTVTFALAGYKIGTADYLHVAVIGPADVACGTVDKKSTTNICLGHGHFPDNGWSQSGCCIMARMTSIGQKNPYHKFYDGVSFGPMVWSGAELAPTAPTPVPGSTELPLTSKEPPWKTTDVQNWPPELNRIAATGVTATGETDTINLAKLPSMTYSINPSTCQVAKKGAAIKYSVKASSAPGLALQYDWELEETPRTPPDTITVPGAAPEPEHPEFLLGPGTAATVHINSNAAFGDTLYTYLWFRDATGTYTTDWNGRTYNASDTIATGGSTCAKKAS